MILCSHYHMKHQLLQVVCRDLFTEILVSNVFHWKLCYVVMLALYIICTVYIRQIKLFTCSFSEGSRNGSTTPRGLLYHGKYRSNALVYADASVKCIFDFLLSLNALQILNNFPLSLSDYVDNLHRWKVLRCGPLGKSRLLHLGIKSN